MHVDLPELFAAALFEYDWKWVHEEIICPVLREISLFEPQTSPQKPHKFSFNLLPNLAKKVSIELFVGMGITLGCVLVFNLYCFFYKLFGVLL